MVIADAITAKKLLTADDLLRMNADGKRGELIRGVFCETMPPGKNHALVASKLGALLQFFAFPRQIGVVVTSDLGIWVERDPDTVRAPDLAYLSIEQEPPDAEKELGFSTIVPDLIVEVGSPNDRLTEMHDKALMWIDSGARMVWNVHPIPETVDVYRPNSPMITLSGDDTLDGYDVIPGFACKVSELFTSYATAEQAQRRYWYQ